VAVVDRCGFGWRGHRRRHAAGVQERCGGAARLVGLRLMLRMDSLNAHYGASHILQGVDLALAPRIIVSVPGRQRRREDHDGARGDGAGAADERPCAAGRGRDRRLGAASHGAPGSPMCPRAGSSSRSDRGREHPGRRASAGKSLAARAPVRAVPCASGARRQQGRTAFGRWAADAGDRPRAGSAISR
jgi:hypothetical protein